MPIWTLYLFSFCLLVAVATLVLVAARRRKAQQELLHRRLAGALSEAALLADAGWFERGLRWLSRVTGLQADGARQQEIQLLLRQAGLISPAARNGFLLLTRLSPLAVAALGWLMAWLAELVGAQQLGAALFGLCLGYLLPRWLARYLAGRRQRAIAEEVPLLLQFLTMLFDAGLSVEHTLRVIRNEVRPLIPELAKELDLVLNRVAAGASAGDSLAELAQTLEVPELVDSIAVLRQLMRRGGGARESIGNLIGLFEDRRRTAVQEQVSKTSAKMSVVMMVFLFPALLVFLAGPGLLALVQALGGLSG